MFYLHYKSSSASGNEQTQLETHDTREAVDQRYNEVLATGSEFAEVIEGHTLFEKEIAPGVTIHELSSDELQNATLEV